jgi:hypothetical protein
MAVNGIGGFAPFPLYIFDAQARARARARDQREQLAQEDAAVQETRAARMKTSAPGMRTCSVSKSFN